MKKKLRYSVVQVNEEFIPANPVLTGEKIDDTDSWGGKNLIRSTETGFVDMEGHIITEVKVGDLRGWIYSSGDDKDKKQP